MNEIRSTILKGALELFKNEVNAVGKSCTELNNSDGSNKIYHIEVLSSKLREAAEKGDNVVRLSEKIEGDDIIKSVEEIIGTKE